MRPTKSRQCLCCKGYFQPDARNTHHQTYCLMPICRKASKAASQRLWLAQPGNGNYHRGPIAVARVSAWQQAHPEYRERQKKKRVTALQEFCPSQVTEYPQEKPALPDTAEISGGPAGPALQDFITTQPFVFVGLIAHFFNVTLQDDIARTTRSLQELGEDIANGRRPDAFLTTGDTFRTRAASASPVPVEG